MFGNRLTALETDAPCDTTSELGGVACPLVPRIHPTQECDVMMAAMMAPAAVISAATTMGLIGGFFPGGGAGSLCGPCAIFGFHPFGCVRPAPI